MTKTSHEQERDTAALLPCLNQERVLLSRAQARLHSVQPPPSLIRFGLRFRGEFNFEALQATLNEIVRRHSGLRIAFFDNPRILPPERERRLMAFSRTGVFEPGSYMQLLLQRGEVQIEELNLVGCDPGEQETAIRMKVNREDARPFDHQRPPLMRATLVKIGKNERMLILFVDHIVSDGWSLPIIREELKRLYPGFCSGGRLAPGIPAFRTSFPEFVAWQNRTLATSYFDDAVKYWREQWARFGPARISLRDLPFSLPPPKTPKFVFGTEHEHFSPPDSKDIRAFAAGSRTTVYAVFLAAFAIVLFKYTHKCVLAIWCHLANRTRPETLDVVGFFANCHILGIDLSTDPSGRELLRQVHGVVTEAVGHQEMPLPHLWRVLKCIPRFPHPIVLMDFRATPKVPKTNFETSDTRLEITNVILPDSLSPRLASLGIYIVDDWERISLSAQYATGLFPQAAMRQLLRDLRSMVLALVSAPNLKASELAGMSIPGQDACARDGEMSDFLLLDSSLIPAVPETRQPGEEIALNSAVPASRHSAV